MERNHNVQTLWRSAVRMARFARFSQPTHPLPAWCFWSVAANLAGAGLLGGVLIYGQIRAAASADHAASASAEAARPSAPHPGRLATFSLGDGQAAASKTSLAPPTSLEIGPRHKLDYQDWLTLLEQEAIAVSERSPDRLTVLLGDSISLWFPPHLLPPERSWLNQGISGEVSSGLLKRLDLIDQTEPETVLVMVGINDLIRDVSSQTLLANYQLILEELVEHHPKAQLVVQSVLPHAGEAATWEGAARLQEIPNAEIRDINDDLKAIALKHDAQYLDLYSLFSDGEGNLRSELTTDGLHLNTSGYLVWATALQVYPFEDR